MSEWKPIETAPRNGKRILAFGGGLDRVEIVSYNKKIGCWDAECFTLDDQDNDPLGYSRPTFWQPLPEPPK